MQLLPYRKLTLYTRYNPQEVHTLLINNTDRLNTNPLSREHYNQSSPFKGSVYNQSFSIFRSVNYRNSFNPEIKGKIMPQGSRTLVEATFSPPGFIIAFMIVWIIGVTFACAAMIYLMVSGESELTPPMFIPFGMFVFGIALVYGGFFGEYGKSRDLLMELLKAEE